MRPLALFILALTLASLPCLAQEAVYAHYASQPERALFYTNFLDNYIQKDLSEPLADSTEDDWSDTFWGMELLRYHSPFVLRKINQAWAQLGARSPRFQRDFLELIYTNYPRVFGRQVQTLMDTTGNERIFALCAEYLLRILDSPATITHIQTVIRGRFDTTHDATIDILRERIAQIGNPTLTPPLEDVLTSTFLPGHTVVYSFQRRNRDYPGLVLIRDSGGHFLRNPDSSLLAVPQLARSITNLPYYLHDGNTPQGLYVLAGLDVSSSHFLGPTPDVQMQMPYETTPSVFLKDPAITDTSWSLRQYRDLFPPDWRGDFAIYGSFIAGLLGRRAIIAHGTTIDPSYYRGQPYFPETPSLGCLCASEIWDASGRRVSSDQQKILDALNEAGGAQGYLLVLELDDQDRPVTVEEVAPAIRSAEGISLHP